VDGDRVQDVDLAVGFQVVFRVRDGGGDVSEAGCCDAFGHVTFSLPPALTARSRFFGPVSLDVNLGAAEPPAAAIAARARAATQVTVSIFTNRFIFTPSPTNLQPGER